MTGRDSGLSAILYLQSRIIVNWFRRSMRSPFFWLIGVFIVFVLAGQIAAVIDGPDDAGASDWLDASYLNAAAAIALLAGILIGVWRGTTNVPGASLADVVVMMGSPVSSRLQFSLLMMRSSVVNALVIGLWSLAAASGLILGIDDNWIALRLIFSVMTIILLSEFLRYAVWVGSEQVVARAPETGRRLRTAIRFVAAAIALSLGAVMLGPVLAETDNGWREGVSALVDRGDALAIVPPMSLAASVLTPGGASLLSAMLLAALTVGIAGLAVFWARDFVEPIAVTAEHKTDARGQMLEAGSDVQWAVLAQYGVSPRLKVSFPEFGRGAWALLWGGLNRWMRYQVAAAWLTMVIMGLFGLATAIGVRIEYVPVEVAWGVVLLFPFFGSVNMFMDELRRQFIFLVPGSASSRLAAAAATSVLDGLFSSLIMIGILLALGGVPLSHAAGLLLLGMAIALVAQASLALVQVLLPFWVGQRVRVSITFGVTGLALLPALGVLVGLYVAAGPVYGLLAAAGIAAASGGIVMTIAALLFDRVEFSG